MSVFASIRNDIRNIYQCDPAAGNVFENLFVYPGFRARQFHHVFHQLYQWQIPFSPKLISHINRFLTGIEIHPGAKLGETNTVIRLADPASEKKIWKNASPNWSSICLNLRKRNNEDF